jgi:hypothetical protein
LAVVWFCGRGGESGPFRLLGAVGLGVIIGMTNPNFVKPNVDCSWFASASGGTTPYLFRWYKNGVYQTSGIELMFNTGTSNFTLRLDVVDARSQTGSKTMSVTVSSSAMTCLA